MVEIKGNKGDGSIFYREGRQRGEIRTVPFIQYGKYFVDDTYRKTPYTSHHRWDISTVQYKAVKKFMDDFQKNNGDWTMGKLWEKSNVCADYVVGMLDAAGIPHPDFTMFGKTDPDKLADWLDQLEAKNKDGKCK